VTRRTSSISRAERQLSRTLSAVKGMALQLVEFALFMYGLHSIVVRLVK
jgi:hypothetical protein